MPSHRPFFPLSEDAHASSPPASASTSVPIMARGHTGFWVCVFCRIASTGGVSAAARAGQREPMTVTKMPTVKARRVIDQDQLICKASNPAFAKPQETRRVSRYPAPTPIAEPRIPTSKPCSVTIENTCPPLAPIARNIANCDCSARTIIWKVLVIINVPTNRAIAANTSKNTLTKSRELFAAVFISSLYSAWLITSAVSENSLLSKARSFWEDTPFSAVIPIAVVANGGGFWVRGTKPSASTKT